MNINTVDLNLFRVFQAIFTTRSATLAGNRIGMTQSAVSNALKRLRERFDDPLFVRTPDGMMPTPLAEQLIGPIETGLAHLAQVIDQGHRFDPATADRLFRIAINDIGQMVMMPQLLKAALRQAPHVQFETVDAVHAEARQKMQGGQLDLAIGSWEHMGDGFHQQRLFVETFVVLMATSNPLAAVELTFDDYMAADHVTYRPSGTTAVELEHTLLKAGVLERRKVVLSAAHSLGLSSIVASSRLLLTAPKRLALAMIKARSDLQMQDAPFTVSPFHIRSQWHERFDQDNGTRWLRDMVVELFYDHSEPLVTGGTTRAIDVPSVIALEHV